jgi:hypothetical protein
VVAVDWRGLFKDKRAWLVAGVGGVGGLYFAARARRQSGTPTGAPLNDGAVGPYASMQPSVYDSSLSDIWEGFNQTALDLQQQINEISDQLGTKTPAPTTPSKGPRPHRTLESVARQYGTTPAAIARASRRAGVNVTRWGRNQPLPYGLKLYVAPGRPLRV